MKTHNRRLMCGTRCAIPRLVRLVMPVLLYRTESKGGPGVAWFHLVDLDIPEIRPEIPRGGISKRLSVLSITLFADSSESVPRQQTLA